MPTYLFNKSQRLLDAPAYKAVFDNANLKVSSQHVLYLARTSCSGRPRLGLVIAKKNVRHATERNRIKRIIRESFRLRQHHLPSIDIIVLARHGLDHLNNRDLHTLFEKLWQQLQTKAEKQVDRLQPKPNR